MREILFRGKMKTDNGELKRGDWVYGDLVRLIDGKEVKSSIYGKGEVILSTIGQYTGLIDKNGTKIFEGDICSFVDFYSGCDIEQYCEGIWEYGDCSFYITERLSCDMADLIFEDKFDGYVIGNIYDNPEKLIKD